MTRGWRHSAARACSSRIRRTCARPSTRRWPSPGPPWSMSRCRRLRPARRSSSPGTADGVTQQRAASFPARAPYGRDRHAGSGNAAGGRDRDPAGAQGGQGARPHPVRGGTVLHRGAGLAWGRRGEGGGAPSRRAGAVGGTMGVNAHPDEPPVRPGSTIGDTGTGMLCAMGIIAALYQRMTTGRGQHIQIAMRDAMLNYCRTPMSRQAARKDQLPRGGNGVFGTAPGGLYQCSPGGLDDLCYIFASRGNPEHWTRLVKAIGREDLLTDPRMKDGLTRYDNREAVDAAITEWTSKRTKQEVTRIIAGAGVPCGAVMTTLELMHDPDLHARGIMQTIEHPVRGPVIVAGWPLRMSDTKVALKCAPILGADCEAIYDEWLGCSPDEVRDMRQGKVI